MWNHLLKIYEESKLNAGEPVCLFKETLIFEEGWLLRSVLKEWKTNPPTTELPFLPFPAAAKVYSEGQLRTPFRVRPKREHTGDRKGESHTHVDGIVGDFSIADGTKSGIELDPGCEYIAVFEAKLYSPLSKGVTYASDYDQVSRTTACLIHTLLKAQPSPGFEAHLVVLYPADSLHIDSGLYDNGHVEDQIADRLKGYKEAGEPTDDIDLFEDGWEDIYRHVRIHFKTWEVVLAEIGDESLEEFYEYCKEFNQK